MFSRCPACCSLSHAATHSALLCVILFHALQRVAMALVAEESEEKDKALVQGLLDFKARMDALVADAFVGNETFSQALRAGLELAANSRDNKPAELIGAFQQAAVALYVDRIHAADRRRLTRLMPAALAPPRQYGAA